MARPFAASSAASPPRPRRRLLILGPVQGRPEAFEGTAGATILIAPLAALDDTLLHRARPDAIHAVLAGAGRGPADLARRLSELGYAGPLRGLCLPAQRCGMWAGQLAQAYPEIAFEVVELAS